MSDQRFPVTPPSSPSGTSVLHHIYPSRHPSRHHIPQSVEGNHETGNVFNFPSEEEDGMDTHDDTDDVMPVRCVHLDYILIPSCWLSWDNVFLIRRAVSRAAPLAYQHSLMILAITRKACKQEQDKRISFLLQRNLQPDKKQNNNPELKGFQPNRYNRKNLNCSKKQRNPGVMVAEQQSKWRQTPSWE